MLCNDCDKRFICQELCPEARAYANQDQVKRTELPIRINENRQIKAIPEKSVVPLLSPQQKQIVRLLARGHTKLEIRDELGISRQALNKQLERLRNKDF
jgi:DNA-binding NarL/FixJ family response regulator